MKKRKMRAIETTARTSWTFRSRWGLRSRFGVVAGGFNGHQRLWCMENWIQVRYPTCVIDFLDISPLEQSVEGEIGNQWRIEGIDDDMRWMDNCGDNSPDQVTSA